MIKKLLKSTLFREDFRKLELELDNYKRLYKAGVVTINTYKGLDLDMYDLGKTCKEYSDKGYSFTDFFYKPKDPVLLKKAADHSGITSEQLKKSLEFIYGKLNCPIFFKDLTRKKTKDK